MSRSRTVVLGLAVVPAVVACVFLIAVLVGQGLAQASLWAAVLGLPAGLAAAIAGVWAVVVPRPRALVPSGLGVPEWGVARPAELSAVVAALLDGRNRTVGITTGLFGAGGFGKTTLALMVCADPRVRRQFGGYVYLVTMGRDVRGAAAIAAKVSEVIKLVGGDDASFTDPELAGRRLGALLDAGPRRLLVLDDVWWPEQLAPLADGGRRCARLVTTRVPGLLAGRGAAVRVDQMSADQARSVLLAGLPSLDPALVGTLLAVTGRWPLLLRLVSKILINAAQAGADVPAAAAQLLARLLAGGPAVVDDLSGEASRGLDVGQPRERALAVRATIGASTSLLDPQDAEWFAELGVFAGDETIPFRLAARLWQATGGLDELGASQVCARLAGLALVSLEGNGTAGMVLHDVVRDFLRCGLGQQRLARLNGVLLDAVAAHLPAARPLGSAVAPAPTQIAWWDLGPDERYLREHLIEHLLAAGRRSDAEGLPCDLRWAGARLQESGAASLAADLSLAGTPRAVRLRAVLARAAHLLAPTEPASAVVDVLHSRVAGDPDWGIQVAALRDTWARPRLVNRWPLPDLPDSALRRALPSHDGWVGAAAIAPDGSWLATGGGGAVRIWDAATGQERAVLTGHDGGVGTVAIAPDGSWLATGGGGGTVRIWDAATGQEQVTLAGHQGWVHAVGIAADGSWLATGGSDGTVRIWDAATGQERATLTGHSGGVGTVAIASDRSWLATAGHDGVIRVWDAATGQERPGLTGYRRSVGAVDTAPDGSWLATGGSDGGVRVWDAATGQEWATLTGHRGSVAAVAIAPDRRSLATGGEDGTVRVWDAATGQEQVTLAGHQGWVHAVAIAPDRSWLATGGEDGTARIWDAATRQERAVLTGHRGSVAAVAIAPDRSWLATGGADGTIRIWDSATGQERVTLTGHQGWAGAVAIAPDGSWLATGGADGTARIWDSATGRERATLTGHRGSVGAVAITPDGSWLATAGHDGVIRVWDPATRQERALMRVDGTILACAWLGARGLVTGGEAGLYLFDFLVGTAASPARH